MTMDAYVSFSQKDVNPAWFWDLPSPGVDSCSLPDQAGRVPMANPARKLQETTQITTIPHIDFPFVHVAFKSTYKYVSEISWRNSLVSSRIYARSRYYFPTRLIPHIITRCYVPNYRLCACALLMGRSEFSLFSRYLHLL